MEQELRLLLRSLLRVSYNVHTHSKANTHTRQRRYTTIGVCYGVSPPCASMPTSTYTSTTLSTRQQPIQRHQRTSTTTTTSSSSTLLPRRREQTHDKQTTSKPRPPCYRLAHYGAHSRPANFNVHSHFTCNATAFTSTPPPTTSPPQRQRLPRQHRSVLRG